MFRPALKAVALVVVLAAIPCPFVLFLHWADRDALAGWFVVDLLVAAAAFVAGRASTSAAGGSTDR